MTLLLVLGLALAADPSPDTAATAAVASPPVSPEPVSQPGPSLDDRIEEAIRVRQQGDPDAARALLVALEPMVPPERRAWYLFQRGICEEIDWQPAAACAFYDQVIALDEPIALDARFRRTLVLEELGRDRAALRDLLAIDRAGGLSTDDALTVALQRGMTEIATGRRSAGIRRIQAALDATEGGDTHRYLRAKARYSLAAALLVEADRLPLRGSEARVVRNLKGRAERMVAAEKQIIALTALKEPEWVLASLIALGDSYSSLATALRASPTPKRLNPAMATTYRLELGKKIENVRTKSFHAYDQGVTVATRIGWESPRVSTLVERRAAFEHAR